MGPFRERFPEVKAVLFAGTERGGIMEPSSIQVNADIARAFQSAQPAQPAQQQQIQVLVSLWLKRAMNLTTLQATMDQMSDAAEANGLTLETLQSILDE
ncbi:hypothetical protein C7B82_01565 [Stenomitos frigidus ULC18]|uniref:Uncharacterized protein n=2 Tax=Stenomitos TaxID=1844270 RepID=A0A2T1ER28_9CYAN|nr:hypothetical protein C7B82_01565 [Stenomitos frigidus ULC18]